MTVTQISPNLYQIVIPTPFRVGPVNVYLAAAPDEPLTLVDTGPRIDQARATLERDLVALRYDLSDIGRIIITHAHSDHYGLAGEIVEISGARIYSHPRNRRSLEDYDADRAMHGAFISAVLLEAGFPQDHHSKVMQSLGRFRHYATSVSPIHSLDEGDELQLAGQRWQVLFMPGHSGGLICLYQPDTRLFISNDHLLRDVSSNPLLEPPSPGQTRRRRSLVDYIASLERTAALSIDVAWPGHGEPIYDHRALIEKRLAFHRRRADKIIAALNDGPQTVYALTQVIFKKLNPTEQFLAVSEVLAHLEWLEDQGAVTCQFQDDVALWCATG